MFKAYKWNTSCFTAVLDICWHLLAIRVQTTETVFDLFFYNKPKWASEQTSERVFVLSDSACQLCALLLFIMTGSQSETMTVACCCTNAYYIKEGTFNKLINYFV